MNVCQLLMAIENNTLISEKINRAHYYIANEKPV
jgi:hypothetical protein